MIERPKGFLYRHSPRGRYEEYRVKHDYLLEQTQGEARYLFEKRLDREAKSYARKKVAIEIIGTAIVASAAVVLGYEIANKRLVQDFHTVTTKIKNVPNTMRAKAEEALAPSAEKLGAVAAASAAKSMRDEIFRISKEIPLLVEMEVMLGITNAMDSFKKLFTGR